MTEQLDTPAAIHAAASASIKLLPCPVCGAEPNPDGVEKAEGIRFKCSRCPHKTHAPVPDCDLDQWRDGALIWNREARKK